MAECHARPQHPPTQHRHCPISDVGSEGNVPSRQDHKDTWKVEKEPLSVLATLAKDKKLSASNCTVPNITHGSVEFPLLLSSNAQ